MATPYTDRVLRATPAEVHFGIEPAHLSAVHAPRGRPGEGSTNAPFGIAYLDTEHRLPFLYPNIVHLKAA